jgi:hypothetical protein
VFKLILTGNLWICFTKFPVALSGGSNENRDPVAGENE